MPNPDVPQWIRDLWGEPDCANCAAQKDCIIWQVWGRKRSGYLGVVGCSSYKPRSDNAPARPQGWISALWDKSLGKLRLVDAILNLRDYGDYVTGEIGLILLGCLCFIIGHRERRGHFGEADYCSRCGQEWPQETLTIPSLLQKVCAWVLF